MENNNKIIEGENVETKTVDEKPRIDESVKQKYCFICQKNMLFMRLHSLNEVGTVNICQACEFNAEIEAVKAKYNGNTKELLAKNAKDIADKSKKAFGKLVDFGKELLR